MGDAFALNIDLSKEIVYTLHALFDSAGHW